MKKSLLGAVTVMFVAQVASAGIDFGQFAIDSGERGYAFGDVITVDGFDMRLFAWNTSTGIPIADGLLLSDGSLFDPGSSTLTSGATNSDGPYAYLDGLSGGKPAGLGVAQELDGDFQVFPSSDDNISAVGGTDMREVVGLQFFTDMTITDFVFRDANHNLINSADRFVDITFDGGTDWTTYTIGANGLVDFGPGGVTVKSTDKIGVAYNNQQLYLNTGTVSAIPEPTSVAVWALMGITLGGCYCGLSRRRGA